MLKVYNTLTKKKEEFKPLKAGDALLYDAEPLVSIERGIGAEVLVFDLPRMR